MREYYFNYCKEFKCIKGECKHNCCTLWEIPLDKNVLKRYKRYRGEHKTAVDTGIDYKGQTVILKNGRCPFLNSENLCDMIIEKGEKYISRVCKVHPRFINYYKSVAEIGLGLCCEEACRIILNFKERQTVIDKTLKPYKGFVGEKIALREKISDIIYDENINIDGVISSIKNLTGGKIFDLSVFAEFFSGLEILTPEWKNTLKTFSDNCTATDESFAMPYRQLLSYFFNRHLISAVDSFDIKIKASFSLTAFLFIKRLLEVKNATRPVSVADLIELARQFSQEIEYSENNLSETFAKTERLFNLSE